MNIDKVMEYARHARTELAKEALAPDDDALAPMIVFGRDGRTLASVFGKRCNRDDGLEVAHIGIRGWSADEVICVWDAHVKEGPRAKDEPPERGSMQKECEENDGHHAEGVKDVLIVVHHDKEGASDFRMMPYQVDYEVGEITWDPVDHLDAAGEIDHEDHKYSGVIPEALAKFFEMDPLDVNLKLDHEKGISDEDDPITRGILGLIAKTTDPDNARREFLDEIVGSLIEARVPCTVVLTREGVEPV